MLARVFTTDLENKHFVKVDHLFYCFVVFWHNKSWFVDFGELNKTQRERKHDFVLLQHATLIRLNWATLRFECSCCSRRPAHTGALCAGAVHNWVRNVEQYNLHAWVSQTKLSHATAVLFCSRPRKRRLYARRRAPPLDSTCWGFGNTGACLGPCRWSANFGRYYQCFQRQSPPWY